MMRVNLELGSQLNSNNLKQLQIKASLTTGFFLPVFSCFISFIDIRLGQLLANLA